MLGVFIDTRNKKIVYAKTLTIVVLEELTKNVGSCEVYKNLSREELDKTLYELKETHEDFDFICAETDLGSASLKH